jgi:hypothetical protein
MNRTFCLIFVILMFSCDSKERAVIFDPFFLSIYSVEKSNDFTIIDYDYNEFNAEETFSYDKIILSPLIYKEKYLDFAAYSGDLFVIDSKNDEKISNIKFSDKFAYEQLINQFKATFNNDILKVIVLMDYDDDLKKDDVEILKELTNYGHDLSFFYITSQKSRSSISKYIKQQQNVDLSIIDSKKYGLYIYELVQNEKIILKDGANLQKLNNNIIMSVDYAFDDNLNEIFTNGREFIYSSLNIY